jgi:hypothetical protein
MATTANPAPTLSYSALTGSGSNAATADFGSGLKVNFSGPVPQGGSTPEFSIGGWIRLNGQAAGLSTSYDIFSAANQFSIAILPPAQKQGSWTLQANFAGSNAVVSFNGGRS